MQGLATQIQIAVAEANVLGIVRLAKDRQRQLRSFGQQDDLTDANFDLPGRQLRIDRLRLPGDHATVYSHNTFRAQSIEQMKPHIAWMNHELGESVVISQIHEQKPAVVAFAVYPPRQPDRLALVREPQGAAGVGAIGVHAQALSSITFSREARKGAWRLGYVKMR